MAQTVVYMKCYFDVINLVNVTDMHINWEKPNLQYIVTFP